MDDTLQETMTDTPQVAQIGDGLPVADDIEKAIEEQITGDAEVPSQADTETLQEAGVALEWLSDLLYTVSKEGVSTGDMAMLLELRSKALARGMALPTCVALETYGDHGFTETRSHLNIEVSNEGIVQTIVDMIKAWIKTFGEWVVKAIRAVRNYQHMDAQVKTKLDNVVGLLDEMQEHVKKWRGFSPGARNHDEELNAVATELFNDGKLKRNLITDAMLGDPVAWVAVRQVQVDAKFQVGRLTRAMTDFQRFVKQEIDLPLVDASISAAFKDTTARAAELLVEHPDPDYLTKADKEEKKRPPNGNLFEIFERPLLKEQRDYVSYEFLIDAYAQASDFLRAANKVRDNLNESDHVSEISTAIAVINDSYQEMYKLIDFFTQVRKMQIAVVTQWHKYWKKAAVIAYEDMMPHRLAPDSAKRAAQVIVEKWNKQMRTWGVV